MSSAQSEATMADVAHRAGVSVSTVSRTLRGLSTVSDTTRARVEAAARELSFAITRSASSLVTGRTGRVAVLTPHLETWFLSAALAGMAPALREAGLDLLVYSVADVRERADFFDRLPARRNADALLVVSFALTPAERARLDGLGMPLVFVSQHAEGRPSVYVDDADAALRGTRHLINLGHRRIAFLQTSDETGFAWSSKNRLAGHLRALADAGLERDDALIMSVPGWKGSGMGAAVGRLLSLQDPPTALFAETDDFAFRLLAALREANVPVPGRVSVMGFDDHVMAGVLGLTTLAQPAAEIGRTAVHLARSVIEDADGAHRRHIVLPTELVPRGSTAPPPTGS
ncbi:LacI family transcriptional regulator [Streptomyces platensis]|uniref:LacI family DNA-binding transcriptional regulator n=2 Tax=Streptomyces TaxID=1883 RepID=UPI002001E296|nr:MULTISPECIES: LacI family DNA-binding transcriptional regulator [Streptomyces]MCX4634927.1 LacI family transcriptional regulator [Streptomyces platensis]